MAEHRSWPALGMFRWFKAASGGILSEPNAFQGVLINLDHFLADSIRIPSGCCHLVGSSTCLLYLCDKKRTVYKHAQQPQQVLL